MKRHSNDVHLMKAVGCYMIVLGIVLAVAFILFYPHTGRSEGMIRLDTIPVRDYDPNDTTCIPNSKLIELAQERREFMYNDSAYREVLYDYATQLMYYRLKVNQDSMTKLEQRNQLDLQNRFMEKKAKEEGDKKEIKPIWYFAEGFGVALVVVYATAVIINKVK